jgi:hypothetical protein
MDRRRDCSIPAFDASIERHPARAERRSPSLTEKPTMTPALVVLLSIIGAIAIILPLRNTRISELRLGKQVVTFTQPIDFGEARLAAPSYIVGAVCLAGALFVSGALDNLLPKDVAGPDETALFEYRDDEGATIVRMLIPNSMAATTIEPTAGDYSIEAAAHVRAGPNDAVTCGIFRAEGAEQLPGESYRPPGSDDWPESGYAFCVSKVGMWAFARYTGGQPEYIEEFRQFIGVNTQGPNRIAVRAEGDSITLSIGGVEVGSYQDDSFSSGMWQLACGTPPYYEPTATCHFSQISGERLGEG